MLDDRWGEVGHAFIVVRNGHELSADGLRAFARDRLAGYKIPRHFTGLDALLRNTIGKILKRELRQL